MRTASLPLPSISVAGRPSAHPLRSTPRGSHNRIGAAAPRDALEGAAPAAQPSPAPAQQRETSSQLWRAYPHIDRCFPGLERVHMDPPVYIAHNFLPAADCDALRSAAEAGQLQPLAYDNKALVDTHRLWPLALVVAAGAGFDAWHSLDGADALSPAALAAAAAPALLRWSVLVGGVLAAALAALNSTVGGRVFTGTKWTAARDPSHPTAPAVSRFIQATSALLETPADRLEAPTVTRYQSGQYQRRHYDARPDGDPAGLKQFLEGGGQRLVQVVLYLNSLTPDQGGGTHFHHPCMDGLTVQPRCGDALIFFPAFADGKFDERMAHSGQTVLAGEKWNLNTWACQRPVPTSLAHLPAPVHRAVTRLPVQEHSQA